MFTILVEVIDIQPPDVEVALSEALLPATRQSDPVKGLGVVSYISLLVEIQLSNLSEATESPENEIMSLM